MSKNRKIWDEIQIQFENLEIDERSKRQLVENLLKLKNQKINLLVIGATGCGKSSTINALFDLEIAKVGYGVDPETMNIEKYELDNLILWDSPGLGDSPEADMQHSRNIIKKLKEQDQDGHALIDLVLVIIDGSSRDMGTSYELINKVIIPNMKEKKRILIAINQCDIAMKGKGWNPELNLPDCVLEQFLEDKVQSVKRRIFESTSVNLEPIFYSALQKYNISKLLSFIVRHTPEDKRAVYIQNINKNPDVWEFNDDKEDYNKEIQDEIGGSVERGLKAAAVGAGVGATVGAAVASVLPVVGTAIGAAVGTVVGAVGGFLGGLFKRRR